MNTNFQRQVDELAEIMRILADVWPGDREDIMVAGARMEDAMEGWDQNSGQLGKLTALAWKGLIHLYEKDEYFQSVKSASLQAINTIREYAVRDGDIDVELFEKACEDLEKSMAGQSESDMAAIAASPEPEPEPEQPDVSSAEPPEPAKTPEPAETSEPVETSESVETPEPGDIASSKTPEDQPRQEITLDDLASFIMTLDGAGISDSQIDELEKLVTICLESAEESSVKPLQEARNIIRVNKEDDGVTPDWESVIEAVSKRIEKAVMQDGQPSQESAGTVEESAAPSDAPPADVTQSGTARPDEPERQTPDPASESANEPDNNEAVKEINFCIPDDADQELMAEFITESVEQIEAAESALLDLETSPDDAELINMVFRSFHTIKGTSAFMGLTPLSEFAHAVETLLDMVRDDVTPYDSACADITLEAIDILKNLLEGVEKANNGDRLEIPSGYSRLMHVLMHVSDFGKPPAEAVKLRNEVDDTSPDVATAAPVPPPAAEPSPASPSDETASESGNSKREGSGVAANSEKQSTATEAPPKGAGNGKDDIITDQPQQRAGSGSPIETASSASVTNGSNQEQRDAGNATKIQSSAAPKAESESTVRVNVNRLDRLIDMVGELVIAHSVVAQDSAIDADPELSRKMTHSTKILRELQDTSLTLRMVPLKATFNKMNRLVRDLGKKGSKAVKLATTGEDTEIDRNMVDIINEPLVHLLRNAIDHGIEEPDERQKSGKQSIATIGLRAFQAGGKVVIEIEDDGRGMNREKILNKAISKGLIEPNKKLSDSEVFKLIFLPGFSTADKVTDLSGRGVGMDVVRRSIEKLHGKVEVTSEEGRGTTISLELPFTLAITDGMLIRIGDQRFIVPTINIDMTFRAEEQDLFTVLGSHEQVMFRGESIPIIRLHKLFNIENGIESTLDGTMLVINNNKRKYALLVDEVIGQQQLVGKSINMPVKMKNISGGAILGDGKVGLILDTVSILN